MVAIRGPESPSRIQKTLTDLPNDLLPLYKKFRDQFDAEGITVPVGLKVANILNCDITTKKILQNNPGLEIEDLQDLHEFLGKPKPGEIKLYKSEGLGVYGKHSDGD